MNNYDNGEYSDSDLDTTAPIAWAPNFGRTTTVDALGTDRIGNYVKITVDGLSLKLNIPDSETVWFKAKQNDPTLSFYHDLIETDKDLQRFKTRLSYYINYFNDYSPENDYVYGPIPPEQLFEGMKKTIEMHVHDYKNADKLINQITNFWIKASELRNQPKLQRQLRNQYRQYQQQRQQQQRRQQQQQQQRNQYRQNYY